MGAVVRMEMRRQSRIVYQGKLRLHAPGRSEAVLARVQNLSPLGVFVTTAAADLPEAGAEVSCGFAFSKDVRTVRGRVAWVRQASKNAPLKSPGAGIEFLDLGAEDAALLHRLVDPGEQARQPVDVWFEGMSASIRCQAVVTGEDVRLATELPFMRIGSLVKVAFTQQPGGVVREGTLNLARFDPSEDGVPHLRLNVSMSSLDNARGTIHVKSSPAAAPGPAAGGGGGGTPEPAPPGPTVTVDPAVSAVAPPFWLGTGPLTSLHPAPVAPPGPGGRGWFPAVMGGVAGAGLVSLILLAVPDWDSGAGPSPAVAAPAPAPSPPPPPAASTPPPGPHIEALPPPPAPR